VTPVARTRRGEGAIPRHSPQKPERTGPPHPGRATAQFWRAQAGPGIDQPLEGRILHARSGPRTHHSHADSLCGWGWLVLQHPIVIGGEQALRGHDGGKRRQRPLRPAVRPRRAQRCTGCSLTALMGSRRARTVAIRKTPTDCDQESSAISAVPSLLAGYTLNT
jgi:hypothetical protein